MLVTQTPLDKFSAENSSFWDANPQFRAAGVFKEIYTKDKSPAKKKSSLMMWFVALCYDFKSKWKNMPEAERLELIGEDFCGSPKYYEENKELIDRCAELYKSMQYTPAKRALDEWEQKMIERSLFIKNTKYSFDRFEEDDEGKIKKIAGNAKLLDEMMSNTEKLYKDLDRIKKAIQDEENSNQTRGGRALSLSDSGEI